MDIIILTILGFLLLAFILIWRRRHQERVDKLMRKNQDVAPLFKEKSAGLKYVQLQDILKDNAATLQTLEQLHRDFDDQLIDVAVYHDALDELMDQQDKH